MTVGMRVAGPRLSLTGWIASGAIAALLFVLWLAIPAQADAARCGGRKATIVGTKKNDRIKAPKKGVQVIHAGGGNDLIIAKRNKDIICGGPGDDRIYGGTGRDKIFGGAGDDFIDEGPGSGKVYAGGGNDVVVGGAGGDTIRGGGGADRLFGEIQDDKIYGDAGDDLIVGGHGIDKMRGGGGNDWLRGDVNRDRYFGDGGSDTASFSTATPPGPHPTRDGVDVDLKAGTAAGDDSKERLFGMENVVGSAFADRITGVAGGFVRGNGGLDSCSGSSAHSCDRGDESPVAYVADIGTPDPGLILLGSEGNDQWTISASGGTVQVTGTFVTPGAGCARTSSNGISCDVPNLGYIVAWGDKGNDSISVGGGISVTTGFKADGGPGNDVLTGGPAGDVLYGGEVGADRLYGGGGDDAIIGRPGGGDLLSGGPGNDNLVSNDPCAGHIYDGGAGGGDVAGFGHVTVAGVRARIGGTAVLRSGGGCSPSRILRNNEILEGSRNSDILIGSRAAELIIGREGNDLLIGGGGFDELRGDAGRDRCKNRGRAIKISC